MSNIKVGDTVEKISGDSFLNRSLTNTVEAIDGRKVLIKETGTTVFIDKLKLSTKNRKLSWIDEFVQSSLLDRMFTREIVRNTTLRCLVVYDFVRASSNLSSYSEEFAKSSTPISYMAAQLVDRYADELLKNRVEIPLNSTRTPVMVEALKAYNKRLDSLKAEVNNSSAPLVTKNCNQYQHGSTLEMHSNKQEEKIMSEEVKTNTVVVEVSTEPYAETTVATFFGKVIDSKSEKELTHVISVIDDKQEALKTLNKNAKSRRIIGQINKLGAARTKVVAMLDSLPE